MERGTMPTTQASEPMTAPLSAAAALLRLAEAPTDADAWSVLITTLGDEMLSLARRLSGDAELARDAVQEALLDLRARAGSFRSDYGEGGDAAARRWILAVVAKRALDAARRQRRTRARERRAAADAAPKVEEPLDVLARAEQASLLRAELARLPDLSGRAIALHHLAGLSFEEVAEQLRVPIGTAKTRVRRGLIALRERLARRGLAVEAEALAALLIALPAAPATSLPLSAPLAGASLAKPGAALALKLVLALTVVAAVPLTWHALATRASQPPLAQLQLGPGWASFGQVLPQGAARGALALAGLDTQCDVKTTWPDGSLRFAVLTARVPAAGRFALVPSPSRTGTVAARAPEASARFTIGGAEYVATLPAQPTSDVWLAGPEVCEWRATVSPTAVDGRTADGLETLWDVRCYRDGSTSIDLAVENVLDQDGAGALRYDAVVEVAGSERLRRAGVLHHYLCRWRQRFDLGLARAEVAPDVDDLEGSGAMPRFTRSLPDRERSATGPGFDLLGFGDDPDDQRDAERPHPAFGPYPDWCARYLAHPRADARAYLMTWGDLAGSFPVHVRERDRSLVDIARRPGFWLDARGAGGPASAGPHGDLSDAALGRTCGLYHPALAYLPYLLTGERWYADELRFWANHGLLAIPPDDRQGARGLLAMEPAAMAWTLRDLVDAAAWLPDGDRDGERFRRLVEENLRWADAYAAGREPAPEHGSASDALGTCFEFQPSYVAPGADGRWPVQIYADHNEVLAWSLGHAERQGFLGGAALRRRLVAFTARRLAVDASLAGVELLAVGSADAQRQRVYYRTDAELVSGNAQHAVGEAGDRATLGARAALREAQRLGVPGSAEVPLPGDPGAAISAGWALDDR
jgi:RNA polymerase sigma factor (sigma-70 family)